MKERAQRRKTAHIAENNGRRIRGSLDLRCSAGLQVPRPLLCWPWSTHLVPGRPKATLSDKGCSKAPRYPAHPRPSGLLPATNTEGLLLERRQIRWFCRSSLRKAQLNTRYFASFFNTRRREARLGSTASRVLFCLLPVRYLYPQTITRSMINR